jgi:hypothetical protein
MWGERVVNIGAANSVAVLVVGTMLQGIEGFLSNPWEEIHKDVNIWSETN